MKNKRFEFAVEEEKTKNSKRYKFYAGYKNKALYSVASLRDINELMKEIKDFIEDLEKEI